MTTAKKKRKARKKPVKKTISKELVAEEAELIELGLKTSTRICTSDTVEFFGILTGTDPKTGEMLVITYERLAGGVIKRNEPRRLGGGLRGLLGRMYDRAVGLPVVGSVVSWLGGEELEEEQCSQ